MSSLIPRLPQVPELQLEHSKLWRHNASRDCRRGSYIIAVAQTSARGPTMDTIYCIQWHKYGAMQLYLIHTAIRRERTIVFFYNLVRICIIIIFSFVLLHCPKFSLRQCCSMEDTFGHGDAECSQTRPTQCSSLRKGSHVLLKSHPCKLVEKCTTAPGKHGPAKVFTRETVNS